MARSRHRRARISGVPAVRLAGIALAVLALAGCNGNHTQAGTAQGRPVVGPFRGKEENPLRQRSENQANRQEMVQVMIWRVTINNQEPKQAEAFWKLFKPARLLANNAKLLERNRLAISSGDQHIWTEALNKLGIGPDKQGSGANQVRQTKTWLAEGFVGEVALHTSPSSPTLFWHEADGTLVGKTYEDCQKLLVITATALPRSRVQIKLTPALKAEGARVRSLRRLTLLSGQEPEKYVAKFEQLAFETIVSPDEFLIIGSAAEADSGSFGRVFFDDVNEQQQSRTVLLIIPQVISSGQVK